MLSRRYTTPLGELALDGPGPLTVIGPTELGRLGGTEDGLSLFVEDGVEGQFEDEQRSELDCCCMCLLNIISKLININFPLKTIHLNDTHTHTHS